eukprot:1158199-Pelagomonas_calceolata.AAC.14
MASAHVRKARTQESSETSSRPQHRRESGAISARDGEGVRAIRLLLSSPHKTSCYIISWQASKLSLKGLSCGSRCFKRHTTAKAGFAAGVQPRKKEAAVSKQHTWQQLHTRAALVRSQHPIAVINC